jgi:hypothetical protein
MAMKHPLGLLAMAVVLLSLFLVPGMTDAQSGRGWMDGWVFLETATKGAAGATVELTVIASSSNIRKLVAKTDERGEYKFKEVPYGEYRFRVTAPGYQPYQIDIYMPPDMHTKLHVRLKKDKDAK